MPTVELIIFLLIVAAVLEVLSRRIGVPRPILLVVAGGLLALMPAAPQVRAPPQVIFFIFLPPLLYWAAINTSYREFRRNGRDIILLAVGLVLATAVAVAAVAHAVCSVLSWPAAFALGAAVGPTDAVAATSVMRRVGVPRTIVSILEGESLVNDATSLVIFEIALAAADTSHFALGPTLLRFVWAAGGGIAAGLAVGWCIALLRRWLRAPHNQSSVVESTASLLTPYVAFVAADSVGVSGVLAVVTVGLYLGHSSSHLLTASSRIQATNMWEVVDFLLEGLLFILVGLGLPFAFAAVHSGGETSPRSLMTAAALVSTVVILLRLVWIFSATYGPRYLQRQFVGKHGRYPPRYPPWQGVLFTGWAGLRGAVSLVLALSIPFVTPTGAPFPGRDLVVFLTFVVILVTLVGQGLTLKPLIHTLGLQPDRVEEVEETRARLQAARAALARLEQLGSSAKRNDTSAVLNDAAVHQVIEHLHDRYTHRIHQYANAARNSTVPKAGDTVVSDDADAATREADSDSRRTNTYKQLRMAMIDAERQELNQLRDDNKISDGVLHRMEHELDLEQMLLTGQNDTSNQ